MPELTREEVVEIRKATGLTQPEFCHRYRLAYGTYIMWEQGYRRVRGASALYLRLIQLMPDRVAEMVGRMDDQPKPVGRTRLADVESSYQNWVKQAAKN